MQEGKGRCDLMPLEIIADWLGDAVLSNIGKFQDTVEEHWLRIALDEFCALHFNANNYDMLIEASKQFEDGAKKYGEHNWKKGIPMDSYIDSAVRHYLKFMRGDTDERHDRAFVWNILCCLWTANEIDKAFEKLSCERVNSERESL